MQPTNSVHERPTFSSIQLAATFRWAGENSEFYRRRIVAALPSANGAVADEQAWKTLERLAPTNKSDLIERVLPILVAEDDHITEFTRSSGTSGLQSLRLRSKYELALVDELLCDLSAGQDSLITLEFTNSYHGRSRAVGPGIQIPVDISNKASVQAAISMLGREFNFPRTQSRISNIAGTVNNILQFTEYLKHNRISSSQFSVTQITCSGSYLSQRSGAAIEEYWKILPTNVFSVSEARGAAAVCPTCGALQFAAHLVPSAITLTGNDPLRAGYGRLCVTELLPFGLCQPLIKFLTGDVVQVIDDPCCELHRGSIRRVGRLSDCIFNPLEADEIILASQDLYEAVDIPSVAREQVWLNYVHEFPTQYFGQPVARASIERSENIRILVEINVLGVDQIPTCELVRDRLLTLGSELRRLVNDGAAELSVVHNGALTVGLKK